MIVQCWWQVVKNTPIAKYVVSLYGEHTNFEVRLFHFMVSCQENTFCCSIFVFHCKLWRKHKFRTKICHFMINCEENINSEIMFFYFVIRCEKLKSKRPSWPWKQSGGPWKRPGDPWSAQVDPRSGQMDPRSGQVDIENGQGILEAPKWIAEAPRWTLEVVKWNLEAA